MPCLNTPHLQLEPEFHYHDSKTLTVEAIYHGGLKQRQEDIMHAMYAKQKEMKVMAI